MSTGWRHCSAGFNPAMVDVVYHDLTDAEKQRATFLAYRALTAATAPYARQHRIYGHSVNGGLPTVHERDIPEDTHLELWPFALSLWCDKTGTAWEDVAAYTSTGVRPSGESVL
jgi:hypothetical protein